MHDDCDPVTFAFVPGGWRGDGETTFSQFLTEVQTTGAAEDWLYDQCVIHPWMRTMLRVRN